MKIVAYIMALFVIGFSTPVDAQGRYSVSVTRKASNTYKLDGKAIWVQTRYCYEYAYSEDAVLTAGQLVFLDSGTNCAVRRVLQETEIGSGTYEISVTHESDELYSALDGFYIRTSMCLELSISEDAILRVGPYGAGDIVFLSSGRKCSVESVLRPMKL